MHPQVSGNESSGESERSHRFHHQQGEITAAAAFEIERLHWRLAALGRTHGVTKLGLNRLRHRYQHREQSSRLRS
jgi:sirohydrochlorin ferrochelatase